MRQLVFAFWASLMSSCSYIPFAGGPLKGEVTEPPDDWTELGAARIVQLETRPSEPYSVKVWVIGSGPDLYVYAGDNRSNWVEHIEADPNVRLAIDGKVFELRAVREEDTERFSRFAQAWDDKYGSDRAFQQTPASAYLFNLQRRGSAG